MDEINQTNKRKILRELQKNARASLSELAKKTGLSRQTVAKTIRSMEKNNQIWGYTTIFDPKLIGKKPFILLGKLDLSIDTENFLKKVTNTKLIQENEEKIGLKASMYLHGNSDLFALLWTENIIEAKKILNFYKKALKPNIIELELLDVITTFRNNGIANPKMIEEWKNLLLE
jgi:Lrp/AsnC family leucine-responsive transcriptional regulator